MGRNRDDPHEFVTENVDETPDSLSESAGGPGDLELVKLARDGDESAFEVLFERYKLRVGRIAGKFFQDHVEDIIQECFVRVYFALPDFCDRGEGSLTAWLSKIAFNTCYDELRRRGRRRESTLSNLSNAEVQVVRSLNKTPHEVSIESAAISRDLANKLLGQLSAEDRLVLTLLDVEGLSVGEIARIMEWSVAKVKIRVFRARADLRKVLKRFL